MTIRQAPLHRIVFESVTQRIEPATASQEPAAPPATMVRICGWCMRALAHGQWVELDDPITTLGLFAHPCAPGLTHGICSVCFERVLDSVDGNEPEAPH